MFTLQGIDLWHNIPHYVKTSVNLAKFSFAKEVIQLLGAKSKTLWFLLASRLQLTTTLFANFSNQSVIHIINVLLL